MWGVQDSDTVSLAVADSTKVATLEFVRDDADPTSYQEWATDAIPDDDLQTSAGIARFHFAREPALTSLVLIHHQCEETKTFERLPVTALFWSDDGRCKGVVASKQKLLQPSDTSIFSRTDLMLSPFLLPAYQYHPDSLTRTLARIEIDMTDDEMSDDEQPDDEQSDEQMSDEPEAA